VTVELRSATAADQALLARALFVAWQWRRPWDEQAFQDHLRTGGPDTYVHDFGRRPGDGGVIAEVWDGAERRFAGAAWYRFFTADDHRPGFVAEDVPELVLAVMHQDRRAGVATMLMKQLITTAAAERIPALSLHVSGENAVAGALYRAFGFEVVRDHEGRGTVMVLRL
jgi:ribosomal protein S18 acetylase RimI-like enzyme